MLKHLRTGLLSGAFAVALASPTLALNTELPDLGNSAGSLVSPQEERDLGRAFMRSVRKSEALMKDPLISDYIQQLGQTLLENAEHSSQRFEFFVIDNPEINAFAGPAGHIGVYSGLMLTTQTESELAAVLAHEIAHVTQQHLLRAWETASNLAVPNAAVLLAAIALGVAVGGDAGIAAAATGQAALLQEQINFTRANEQEADRIGIDILAKSDFEPRAMPAFFDRMGKANRVYASDLPDYLRTHPVSTSRIADSLGRATEHPYHQNEDEQRYLLIKALLNDHTNPTLLPTVSEYQRMLLEGRYRNRAATQFALALALLRADQKNEALKVLDELVQAHPQSIEFVVSRARLQHQRGDSANALKQLEAALLRQPGSYALNISFAEIALALGQAKPAQRQLQNFLLYRDQDPAIYRLLARTASALNEQEQADEYQALYHYTDGRLEQAILQLEIALRRLEVGFYQRSRLESRLKAWQAELDAQERRR